MRNTTPITGKAAQREARRMEAARLFERGELSQAQIARQLRVSRQSVSVWYSRWKRSGRKALAARGPLGRPFRLSAAQIDSLKQALVAGAVKSGFSGELWTIERVRTYVARRFGVRYGRSGTWNLLGLLGFTSQRPGRVAAERDPEGARRWRREFARVKKTPANTEPGSPSSTSPGSASAVRSARPGPRGAARRS